MNSGTLTTTGNQNTNKIINVTAETKNHEQKLRNEKKDTKNEEKMAVEVERKTGVSFPVKLSNGKELKAIGIRKKNVLGLSLKIYSFGIYADNQKLMSVLKSKFVKASPEMATKEKYEMVINNPVGITVKMVIVFPHLPMSMVRKNFNEGIGVAIRKLGGGNNNDLTKSGSTVEFEKWLVKKIGRSDPIWIMGEAKEDIKLTSGSEIEVTCLPGYFLETKVCGKVVNKIESELLCRACVYLYLGDDPLDKEAKDKFGMSLLSLI